MIRTAVTGRSIAGEAVLHAEMQHQRTIIRNGRVSWFWIISALVLMVPALITAVAIFAAAVVAGAVPSARAAVLGVTGDWGQLWLVHMMGMAVASDVVISLVALALATNAISREKRGETWELLVMTGVPAVRVILAKWWASVHIIRRDYNMVMLLRLGLVGWAYVATLRIVEHGVWSILLAGVFAVGFSYLDRALTAATAVLAALVSGRVEGVPGAAAVLLKLGAIVVAVCVGFMLRDVLIANLIWLFLLVPLGLTVNWLLLLPLTLLTAIVHGM